MHVVISLDEYARISSDHSMYVFDVFDQQCGFKYLGQATNRYNKIMQPKQWMMVFEVVDTHRFMITVLKYSLAHTTCMMHQ